MKSITVALLLLVLAGCGGADRVAVVPASGKLYLDGEPHGPATLVLYPVRQGEDDKRPTVGGEVAADGSFTLMTYEPGDGAPPGEYQVQVMAGGTGGEKEDPAVAAMASISTVPVQDTTVEIPSDGSENLEIRLQSAAPAKKGPLGPMLGK